MNTAGNAIPAAGGASGREGAPCATDLMGQVAVVTGASRGIGQAIAIRLGL
jgi:3-oxoacyl-[acyl-carrier protein] reductase